MFDDIIKVYIL